MNLQTATPVRDREYLSVLVPMLNVPRPFGHQVNTFLWTLPLLALSCHCLMAGLPLKIGSHLAITSRSETKELPAWYSAMSYGASSQVSKYIGVLWTGFCDGGLWLH